MEDGWKGKGEIKTNKRFGSKPKKKNQGTSSQLVIANAIVVEKSNEKNAINSIVTWWSCFVTRSLRRRSRPIFVAVGSHCRCHFFASWDHRWNLGAVSGALRTFDVRITLAIHGNQELLSDE